MADEQDPPEGGDDKTFTQAELDRIIADRLKRAEKQYADYDELKAKASKLDEQEAANKSEVERLTEQVATLTQERDTAIGKADRLEVAISKSLDEDRASRISTAVKRLTGTTREELEADADELLPLLFPPGEGGERETPAGKPREDLRGGGDPTESPESDVRSVVDSIPRGF
jgi:hypothetical protein